MKKQRLEKIIEIITEYEIETQEDLIAHLKNTGYDVTQATVSRDIRELKLTKMTTGHGTYRYVIPKTEDDIRELRINHVLAETILRVEYAQNLVVVHTMPGMAQAIAVEVDHLGNSQILGCVAGDDTILIVTPCNESAVTVSEMVRDMIRTPKKNRSGHTGEGN